MFVALLRTTVSTLRNCEQERASHNAQAALLLKLVGSAPEETLAKLSAFGGTKRPTVSRKAPVKRRTQRDAPPKKAASKRAVA